LNWFEQYVEGNKHFLQEAELHGFISSPELKAQVSYSDRLLSVVRLSVNFYIIRLLLQNHWAIFNQTWHKSSLGGGDSNLFK
jgi:hypothetical protein